MMRWICVLLLIFTSRLQADERTVTVDAMVYTATPAGIASAISAGSGGHKVLLIEPTDRIGGMTTNGLSHTDFRTFEGISGTYLDFCKRIKGYYAKKYGAEAKQVKDCFRGTHGEPHVNRIVFEKMLAEVPSVQVRKRLVLKSVQLTPDKAHILSVVLTNDKETFTVHAKVFIDASYEGDLMAKAGVPFRVGREARSTYNETLAPMNADKQVQGYNFRLIMTKNPKDRVPIKKPDGYNREEFLKVIPLLGTKTIKTVFCRSTGGVYKAHLPGLPNDKHDVNDVSRSIIRLSLPDINNSWPNGDLKTRGRIFAEHLMHNVGLLYFLQNDKAVPEQFQKEAREWSWCRDEFVDNGHLPHQLYVREARRMMGQYVFTEHDTDCAKDDARAVLHKDAIAMGDYGPNCHGTDHVGPRFGGRHTGEFYKRVAPYQIPYGVLIPRKVNNLLVPVATSASHVGFCALRLEPIWTSLGQAAGFAARHVIEKKVSVQKVSVPAIQKQICETGGDLIYVSDVLPGSKDFAAVQWWGCLGGLHGLSPRLKVPGQRGEHLLGQYYHAFPGHAVEMNRALDDDLKRRWLTIAKSAGLKVKTLESTRTRGDFIRTAYRLVK